MKKSRQKAKRRSNNANFGLEIGAALSRRSFGDDITVVQATSLCSKSGHYILVQLLVLQARDWNKVNCAFRLGVKEMQASGSKIIVVIASTIISLCIISFYSPGNNAIAQPVGSTMKTPSGLQITDIKLGNGPTPRPGQICVMHYTGWLYVDGKKAQKFDSSLDRGQPFEFPIGQKRVIGGWDEGVASMKVGGKRTLIIPPELGYGARGAGGVIPPNATLIFDVELLGVKD